MTVVLHACFGICIIVQKLVHWEKKKDSVQAIQINVVYTPNEGSLGYEGQPNINNNKYNIELFNLATNLLFIVILVLMFGRFYIDITSIPDFVIPIFTLIISQFLVTILLPMKLCTNRPEILTFACSEYLTN